MVSVLLSRERLDDIIEAGFANPEGGYAHAFLDDGKRLKYSGTLGGNTSATFGLNDNGCATSTR